MPFDISWNDEQQTVILCVAQGEWTWEAYHHGLEQIVQLANGVAHPVYVINIRGATTVTPAGSGIPHYQRAAKIMPANVRQTILVSNTIRTRIATVFLSGFLRIVRANVIAVPSLEEAYKFIEADRVRIDSTAVTIPDSAR